MGLGLTCSPLPMITPTRSWLSRRPHLSGLWNEPPGPYCLLSAELCSEEIVGPTSPLRGGG